MRRTTKKLERLALALTVFHVTALRANEAEVDQHAAITGGYVAVADCRLMFVDDVQLASERAGILEVVAPEGSSVSNGASIARLRDSVLRTSLAIAERQAANDVEIRFARKSAHLAQLNFERAAQANRTLAGTVAELELSELALAAEKATLQLEQAEHQHALAMLRRDEMHATLATLQIAAPFDAFVRSVYRKPGEFVQAGEAIAEIVNSSSVRVEGYISAADLRRVRPGQRVEVRLAADGIDADVDKLRFYGEVGFVDVKVEPVSQKVRVWADVENAPPVLREGLPATMFIEVVNPGQPSGR
jgi:multidrug efflux pump subunit AcrA (membrane-fusion protein)